MIPKQLVLCGQKWDEPGNKEARDQEAGVMHECVYARVCIHTLTCLHMCESHLTLDSLSLIFESTERKRTSPTWVVKKNQWILHNSINDFLSLLLNTVLFP